ncbi:Uncharacterised protein [uncultured archaeon]|nr:Uncharacterised protein [uncultured archaeon]
MTHAHVKSNMGPVPGAAGASGRIMLPETLEKRGEYSAQRLREEFLARESARRSPKNVLKRQAAEKALAGDNLLVVNAAVVVLGNLAYMESARPLFELLKKKTSAGIQMSVLSAIRQIANDHSGNPELDFGVKRIGCFIRANIADADLTGAALRVLKHIGRVDEVIKLLRELEKEAAPHPESLKNIRTHIRETINPD